MSEVVLEATNAVEGGTSRASIVTQRGWLDYRLAPSSAGKRKEPQRAPVTLTATATRPKSPFSMKKPAGLHALLHERCKRHDSGRDLRSLWVIPDQGEFQLERQSIP